MVKRDNFHERLDRYEVLSVSSHRSFCLMFSGVFAVLGIHAWRHTSHGVAWAWFALSVLFLTLALFRPELAAPLNRLWTRLGLLLARITNPIFLSVLYFIAIVPVGWGIRLAGKDPLRLKRDASARSYWIIRNDQPENMTNQF